MHLKRIIAAVVFTPLFLLLVIKGSPLHYAAFVLVLALLGLVEYFKLVDAKVDRPMKAMGILWGMFIAGGLSLGISHIIIAMMTFGFIAICLLRLSKVSDISTAFQDIGYAFLGPLYVGLLLGHLTLIRGLMDGREWTLILFFTIWMGDIAAFYTGLSLGRNKLYPAVSPNKTVEGAIGGLLGSLIIVAAAKTWYMPKLTFIDVAVVSVGIGVMGQLGDLCESMFKRAAGVKDSGNIIPGHGGVLDRFDSVIFAAPFLYYYLVFIKGMTRA